MRVRLPGMLRLRGSLLILAALLAFATSASASWQLPGSGAGLAQASTDFHSPTVIGATIARTGQSGAGGAVQPGATFVVYADVVDPGVSGVDWVHADVSALHAGASAVALAPCAGGCTIAGVTYGWSSAVINADAGLAQGTRSFSLQAQDKAGNLGGSASYSAIVDSTAPTVSAVTVAMAAPGAAGWVHRSGTYAVYAKATDGGAPASGVATVTADVSALTAGTTALALPRCASGCTVSGVTYTYKGASTVADGSLADGAFTVPVTATDVAGNSGGANATTNADSTPPAIAAAMIAASSPTAAGWVKPGGTYIVYANASDAGGFGSLTADVSSLTAGKIALALPACASGCAVGGVTYAYKSATTTAGTSLAAGPVPFSVTATDKAANATSGSYSVTADTSSPVVTAATIANTTTSAPGWLRPSGVYIVYANATDTGSGVSSVTANVSTITSGQTALALTACTTSCTVGGITYAYKSASKTAGSALAAGPVSFTVTANDAVSHATTANGSATVDATAPAVSAIALATTATMVPGYLAKSSTYVVYANPTDDQGINKVTANVNNLTTGGSAVAVAGCVSSCTVGGVAHTFSTAAQAAKSTLGSGSKTYTITVQDLAGNSTTSAAQTVTVDNTAPTVAITFPTAGYSGGWAAGCSTPVTEDVCGTASDASAGVAGVQVSLRQAAAPNLYWDPGTSSFSSSTEVLFRATLALPAWSVAAASSWFTNLTSYTLRAVATDAASNTATTSTTFTFHP